MARATMYRFARQPRWILGHVLVAVAVVVMVNLGFWQLRRLDERRAVNELVEARTRQAPAPLTSLLDDAAAPDEVEFRRATATGTFDPAHEVLVGYRSSKGLPGFHVVTPLVLDGGRTVLVNRGFVPLALADRWPVADAVPPPGEVTVTGLVRDSSDGGHEPEPPAAATNGTSTNTTKAKSKTPRTNVIDVDAIATVLPAGRRGELLPVQLELQQPVPPGFPDPLPPLDLGQGPHLSYAVQWFAFSAVAAGGWVLLLRRHVARTSDGNQSPAEPLAGY